MSYHSITKMDAIKRLRILDRMGLIELLPGDRIRRRAKRDFDWIQDGPIRHYFAEQGLTDFIAGPFDPKDESLEFAHGMLTGAAQGELKLELRRLRAKLASLHEQSIPANISEKRGVGLLLALRRWEPIAFARLRRHTRSGPWASPSANATDTLIRSKEEILPIGKPGDHPLTDILIHNRNTCSPEVCDLVREIAALADEKTRRELGDLLLTKYNEYSKPDMAELEAYLIGLRDRLKRDAKSRGFGADNG